MSWHGRMVRGGRKESNRVAANPARSIKRNYLHPVTVIFVVFLVCSVLGLMTVEGGAATMDFLSECHLCMRLY